MLVPLPIVQILCLVIVNELIAAVCNFANVSQFTLWVLLVPVINSTFVLRRYRETKLKIITTSERKIIALTLNKASGLSIR